MRIGGNARDLASVLAFVLSFSPAALVPVFSPPAMAADLPGAADPSFMQRFTGSEIVDYVTKPYLQYTIGLDPYFKKTQTIEGQTTRIVYRVPGNHTVIELIRNYEQSMGSKGFKVAYEVPFGGGIYSNNYVQGAYYQSWQPTVQWGAQAFNYYGFQEVGGVVEKGSVDGRDVTVVVSAASYRVPQDGSFTSQSKPIHFTPTDLGVIVDVITSAQIQANMVTVKAADMADALATKGMIDLYGVYFDTDKTTVRTESGPTLDEVASLLKIDRSLKLEISGHTDNTGSSAHNLKLSQGRAQAVVQILVTKYGIGAKRLSAKGYGDTKPVASNATDDGKAKNRRVELRKI
jgi:OOP family OmpA-OmpF porin